MHGAEWVEFVFYKCEQFSTQVELVGETVFFFLQMPSILHKFYFIALTLHFIATTLYPCLLSKPVPFKPWNLTLLFLEYDVNKERLWRGEGGIITVDSKQLSKGRNDQSDPPMFEIWKSTKIGVSRQDAGQYRHNVGKVFLQVGTHLRYVQTKAHLYLFFFTRPAPKKCMDNIG